MRPVVKVDGWDVGLPAGPVVARNVQFSGIMPGGHAVASFEVPVASAYLPPHHTLRVGHWVTIYDNAHELYEGEVMSVKPVVDVGGQHKFVVTCGGLMAVAARRQDLSKTWVRRGAAGWRIEPGANLSGEYTVGTDGDLQLLIREGATENYTTPMRAWFVIDDLLSGDYVSHVAFTAAWDVLTEAPYSFSWTLSCDDDSRTETNTESTGTADTLTPTGSTKYVQLSLSGVDLTGARVLSGDRFVSFSEMDVYGSSKVAKVRIDQAMVDVATRTGLATSSVSLPVGIACDDLHFERTSSAVMLNTLAGLHAQQFDWGFWDEKTFYARPLERQPTNPARVVVVGGGMPGLVSWDVQEADDDTPDFVCVYFGNVDNTSYPQGWVRRVYVPYEPDDTADVTVQVVDYSNLLLSDAAATAVGGNLLAGDGEYALPSGYVWAVHPEFADSAISAGNNADPTEDYAQLAADAATGTVTAGYVAGSGWEGTNSPLDPTCLVLDGTDDEVTWGDYAGADFGTGAFSVSCWFRLDAVGKQQTVIGKVTGSYGSTYAGWGLVVTASDNLMGFIFEDATRNGWAINATTLVAGTWYHAAMTFAGAGAAPKVYVNGQEDVYDDDTVTYVGTGASTAGNLKLGAV